MLMLSLPSVFQTLLVAPLLSSCALSWWQISVGTFVSIFCASYISVPLLSSPCCKLFKADRLEWCFLVLSSILLLLCSSSPLPSSNNCSFLSPSPHQIFPTALVAPSFSTTFSSQLLPKSIEWSPKGAWCLKGWVWNKSGVEVVQCSMGCGRWNGVRLFVPFAGYSNPWPIIRNNGWRCAWDIS